MYQRPLCIVPGIALAVVLAFPVSSAAQTAGSYFYRLRATDASGQTLERSKKVQLVR